MNDDLPIDGALEEQLKRLLVDIEQEPLSPEVRALAQKLQKLLDERQAAQREPR